MTTVAIIGILAAVAYPSYRDYILRGQLTDATNGLSAVRANMERFFQDNRTYATSGTFVTPCATTDPGSRTFGNFVITCSPPPTATAFTLVASGSGPTTGFTFTIDQLDTRATTAAASGWSTCSNKWMIKKGMVC